MTTPHRLQVGFLLLVIGGGWWTQSAAGESAPKPHGSLFRALAGDTLERDHNIALLGIAHVSVSAANHNISRTNLPQGRARGVQPQSGVLQDTGLNLQHVGLMLCKGAGCPPGHVFEPNRNVLSRVTPLPGPRGDEVIVDWTISALYGEDAVFWATKGFDDFAWQADKPHRLAITQWYLDIFLPIFEGVSVLVGSWHSPHSAEIGYPFIPPNLFSSRSHIFSTTPTKHVGALAQAKLPLDPAYGLLSFSFGIGSDWGSIDFGSGGGGPQFIFGLRWRSPDMQTWLDFEAIYGNGEDDFGDVRIVDGVARPRGGGSQFLALSSTNEYLDRFAAYWTLNHKPSDRIDITAEAAYGYQEGGDLAPLPFAVTRDSEFYGVNAGFRYRLAPRWHAGARFEWFRDENAANVLWGGVGATGGDVYATTLNITYEPIPYLAIRPELKFDAYDGGGHLFAADSSGLAQHDEQLLGVINFEFRF